jgi:hypothetical protein
MRRLDRRVITLYGYGISVHVDRGHLALKDGIGSDRHEGASPVSVTGFAVSLWSARMVSFRWPRFAGRHVGEWVNCGTAEIPLPKLPLEHYPSGVLLVAFQLIKLPGDISIPSTKIRKAKTHAGA